jgi:hypothetical protein
VRLGAPDQKLTPYKGLKFRIPEFADVVIEFAEENGQIVAMKQIDPSGSMSRRGNCESAITQITQISDKGELGCDADWSASVLACRAEASDPLIASETLARQSSAVSLLCGRTPN